MKKEKINAICLILLIFITPIINFFNYFFLKINYYYIIYFLVLYIFILKNRNEINKILKKFIFKLYFLILIIFLQIFLYPDQADFIFLKITHYSFIMAIFTLFITSAQINWSFFEEKITKISLINIGCLIFLITKSEIYKNIPGIYMVFGFNLLINMYFLLVNFEICSKKMKILKSLLYFMGMLFLLMYGNRSALLLSLLFYIEVLMKSKYKYKVILALSSIGVVISIILLNVKKIYVYCLNLGIMSRNMYKIIELLSLNNLDLTKITGTRNLIYIDSFAIIQEKIMFGNGVGILYKRIGIEYAHNILLDILLDFGILGFTLFIVFIYIYLKRYINLKNSSFKRIIFILLNYQLVLLFSSVYYNNEYFWLIISIFFIKKGGALKKFNENK